MNKSAYFLDYLERLYPGSYKHLNAKNPWELLVATLLAAQCTDARVNLISPKLFERCPSPAEMANISQTELEELIRSTGFYRNKAKNLLATAKRIMEVYAGQIPPRMEDLITLPGIARKTANCVLCGGFGINVGIAVDTHVLRIAKRLGFTTSNDPVVIEQDLMHIFPQSSWGNVNHRMVLFGRHMCIARKPKCLECEMNTCCLFKTEQT